MTESIITSEIETPDHAADATDALLPEYAHAMRRIKDLILDAANDEIGSLAATIASRIGIDEEEDEEHFAAMQSAIFDRALNDLLA